MVKKYNNPLTNLGKFLRLYRLDHGMVLYDMAKKLNMSSSELSGIEMGRKPIPTNFLEKLIETYTFTISEKEKLFNECYPGLKKQFCVECTYYSKYYGCALGKSCGIDCKDFKKKES